MTQNINTPATNDALKVVFEQIQQVKNNLYTIQNEINELKQINNNIAMQYQKNEHIHEMNYRSVQNMAMVLGVNQQIYNDADTTDDEMPAKRRKLTHYTERESPSPRPILPRPTLLPAPANSAIANQYAILESRNDPAMPVAPPSTPNNTPPLPKFTNCFDEPMSNHYFDIDGFYDF
jgi:hypothetical protein